MQSATAPRSPDRLPDSDRMPPTAKTFDLLALPHDLLHGILSQPCIGARELCRLEQTAHALSAFVVDDDRWQRVFLQNRRCPALVQPSSWKSELARREDWSRSWRQLGLASSYATDEAPPIDPSLLTRCVVPPSRKKLRRLAMMMFPGGLAGAPAHSDVHIVDPNHQEYFASIGAAIACAKPRAQPPALNPHHFPHRR